MSGKGPAALVMSLALVIPAAASRQSDPELARAVQREVLQYPQFTIFDSVHARVDGGVVTLTGRVTMDHKREAIAERVAGVGGVTEVRNQIGVLPVSSWDDELRSRIARAIYGNSNFWTYASMPNPPIHIIVERAHVTLEGVVNSEVDRMLAYSIAGSFNALSVTNKLRTGDD